VVREVKVAAVTNGILALTIGILVEILIIPVVSLVVLKPHQHKLFKMILS